MIKDYIFVNEHEENEIKFVEQYWTNVWDKQGGGAKGLTKRIYKQDEYKLINPFLALLPSDSTIIDAGCGLGDWVIALSNSNLNVIGIDISRVTIAKLRGLYPAYQFQDGDIRNIKLPDSSVHAYYSWGVFEHFESGPQDCLREALRVLKPGGYLFITVPFENLRHSIVGSLVKFKKAQKNLRFYQYRFTRAELATELGIAGFEIVEIKPIHKRQGVLRSLNHNFGLPYEWRFTKAIAFLLAFILPSSSIGHMVMGIARKPG